ncbi:MAG TPA: hypothetical protein VHQ64_10815 [Pyrinomonadaceae bacterium]|jgi:hypothetical protein|nr:hypothetical protein [Pyrinomonadaceae bacterium]
MGANFIIVTISSLTAILVAAFTYYTTKQREREAEWRREKLTHYKDYFAVLAETIGEDVSRDARARYCIAFNTVGLFASQEVIDCLHAYQEITRLPYAEVDVAEHDRLLTKLVLAVRRDLKLRPDDDSETFSFHMIAPYRFESGVEQIAGRTRRQCAS